MEEIWKDIEGTKNRYQVSNMGRVRKDGALLKTGTSHKKGYVSVSIGFIFGRRAIDLHRLVAAYFCGIPENYDNLQINHIDGNKQNNCYTNLEWCTPKENQEHRRNILGKHMLGEKNPMYGRSGVLSPVFKGYILQIEPSTGAVVGRYAVGREAASAVNGSTSHLFRVLNKKTKYHGYIWKREQQSK